MELDNRWLLMMADIDPPPSPRMATRKDTLEGVPGDTVVLRDDARQLISLDNGKSWIDQRSLQMSSSDLRRRDRQIRAFDTLMTWAKKNGRGF